MDVAELAAPSGEQAGAPDSIRITRQGKLRFWVQQALDFFKDQPDRPLVLYSTPADISASTIGRLVSVAEIIKREYLQEQDFSAGDVSGLHQYNQLLCEQRGEIPAEEGQARTDALHLALDGHSYVKRSLLPHMKITLSVKLITHRCEPRETHQAPPVRSMSKAAKARMRKRMRMQDEIVDHV